MEAAELAVAFDLLWLREVQALSQRLPLVTLPPGRGPVLWAAPFGAAYGLHPGVPQPQGSGGVFATSSMAGQAPGFHRRSGTTVQLRPWRWSCRNFAFGSGLNAFASRLCLWPFLRNALKLSLDPPKREARILQEE